MIKIWFFTEKSSGCYKYRTQIPVKYLEKTGKFKCFIISHPNDIENSDNPDILMFYRIYSEDLSQSIPVFKSLKLPVVWDTDDAQELVPSFNVFRGDIKPILKNYFYIWENADCVTTTTSILANHLKKRNHNVYIIPNALDDETWKNKLPKPRNSQLRIGFVGSLTHIKDIQIVLPVIKELQKKYDFVFVLKGLTETNSLETFLEANPNLERIQPQLYREVLKVINALKDIKYEYHPWSKIENYENDLYNLNLDIGLAPLENNKFNQYKSCIKFYEYAIAGIPSVCSQVLPYTLEPTYTAKNNFKDWYQKLERLIVDIDFWYQLREQQRNWVLQNRMISVIGKLWENLFLNHKC